MMQLLEFEPLLKRIRWGGRRLGTLLGKSLGPESDYAESWEIADQPGDQSRVASGALKGLTLGELVQESGKPLLGDAAGISQFPLLIKYLDAHDWLSLQVHPNDVQARVYDVSGRGKTEAWVIIEAGADSRICAGLKSGVTSEQLQDAMAAGHVEECLHICRVQPGDCFFVPAGTVHALGPGIVLAEVQQQSNLTFRLHDWGRLGSDGQPRPLHLKESLECIDFERGPLAPVVPQQRSDGEHAFEELVHCPWFVIRRHVVDAPFDMRPGNRFRIVMVLSGSIVMSSAEGELKLSTGRTVLLPAERGVVRVIPQERAVLLEILQPE